MKPQDSYQTSVQALSLQTRGMSQNLIQSIISIFWPPETLQNHHHGSVWRPKWPDNVSLQIQMVMILDTSPSPMKRCCLPNVDLLDFVDFGGNVHLVCSWHWFSIKACQTIFFVVAFCCASIFLWFRWFLPHHVPITWHQHPSDTWKTVPHNSERSCLERHVYL